jgi:hypothetical protein
MAGILLLCLALFRGKWLNPRRPEFDRLKLKRSNLSGLVV